MQGLLRNPLAEPGVLGVSAMTAFGATRTFSSPGIAGRASVSIRGRNRWMPPTFFDIKSVIKSVIIKKMRPGIPNSARDSASMLFRQVDIDLVAYPMLA
jgi:hypothetical protein